MPMKRSEFLEQLETVAPALASNDLIPILTHIWFSKDRIMAYNDVIAIGAPCDSGFTGAVPGQTLLNLLKMSRAKEVKFTTVKDELEVKAAASVFRLSTLPADHFVFSMPKPQKKQETALLGNKQFLESIDTCLRSVSSDTSKPEHLGITLLPDKDNLEFYSTDSHTITHTKFALQGGNQIKKRVVLSAEFCRQLTQLGKSHKLTGLEINEDSAIARTGDGVELFGRLIEIGSPLDLAGVLKNHLPEKFRKKAIPIPARMKLVLERATIIAEMDVERTKTTVTIRDNVAKFFTKSKWGEVSDTLPLEAEHEDIAFKIEAPRFKSAIDYFDNVLFGDSSTLLIKGNAIHLISASK